VGQREWRPTAGEALVRQLHFRLFPIVIEKKGIFVGRAEIAAKQARQQNAVEEEKARSAYAFIAVCDKRTVLRISFIVRRVAVLLLDMLTMHIPKPIGSSAKSHGKQKARSTAASKAQAVPLIKRVALMCL